MNPLKQFKQVVSDLRNKIRNRFAKTMGIKTIGEYKAEINRMLEDLEIISDYDTIDELISQMGIQGVAQEYININRYYKEYYKHIINEIKKAQNTSNELKNFVRAAEDRWERTYKDIINYLYDKKQEALYGVREDVHIYHANSFADEPLPWLRKEDISEGDADSYAEEQYPWLTKIAQEDNISDEDDIALDYQVDRYNNDFYEGLAGMSIGAAAGAVLAVAAASLSAAFHIHPRLFTGLSTAVGAIIGQYVQKHFFIDFTNYVKLKRYVTHYPESFEIICNLMERNAVKFQQKDPVKYKKILMNLKRLQNNPPENYRNYLDDEIDALDADTDAEIFNIRDREGNTIVDARNDNYSVGYSNSNRSDRDSYSSRRSRRSRKPLRTRDYDMNDFTSGNRYSNDDIAIKTQDLLGDI